MRACSASLLRIAFALPTSDVRPRNACDEPPRASAAYRAPLPSRSTEQLSRPAVRLEDLQGARHTEKRARHLAVLRTR